MTDYQYNSIVLIADNLRESILYRASISDYERSARPSINRAAIRFSQEAAMWAQVAAGVPCSVCAHFGANAGAHYCPDRVA